MPDTVTFDTFTQDHLDGALRLSLAAGWPHRREDGALVLGISRGIVALAGDKVVGTAIATPFGLVAMANTIVVDETMRGRGLGRRLMEQMLALVSPQEWRLVATMDGLPLYEKLGFREVGEIVQLQGKLAAVEAPTGVDWATPADFQAIVAMDQQSTGAERTSLLSRLAQNGKLAVIREAGAVTGYAALRAFGRGEVVGPVVAQNQEDAKRLLSFMFCARNTDFVRVDTSATSGLVPWLEAAGLTNVGGGIAMQRGEPAAQSTTFQTYALATQALG